MAGRGRTPLTSRKPGRAVAETATRRSLVVAPKPLLYTAQDVARFCEVDLKTIHHWADGGKIAHHRTEGRHLRFRRNHVVAFLRGHGYPLHDEITTARPTVFYALASPNAPADLPSDDIAKKLSARFFVRKFDSALTAIAHLVAGEPDALVVSIEDPTSTGTRAVSALKAHADTSWPALVVVTADAADETKVALKEAGADLVIGAADIGRLHAELARVLAVE